jgi:hypothetical protein
METCAAHVKAGHGQAGERETRREGAWAFWADRLLPHDSAETVGSRRLSLRQAPERLPGRADVEPESLDAPPEIVA